MKTGVIITADISDKKGEEIFETVHVNYVFIPNDGDWRKSNNENGVDPEDVKHYIEERDNLIGNWIAELKNKT